MTIPFGDLRRQNAALRAEIDEAISRVLDSGWFILGQEVAAFEQEFAAYCETTYAIGVDSGYSALELIVRAYDIGPGDEVITAANTFIATVLAIGKTIETVRNYLKKRKAKKQQKAAATEMFDQAYAAGPESQTYQSFTELLGALNIPVPDPASNKFKKERSYAIDQLAPHLARSDDAIKEALPEQAEEFVARADAEADAQIAEVEAAAAAAGVDAAAQSQAGGGPDAEEAGEQEEEVAAPA